MGRKLYHFVLYAIIVALLVLYVDARMQLGAYQTQKQQLCRDLRLVTATVPELYDLCTTNPTSWFAVVGE